MNLRSDNWLIFSFILIPFWNLTREQIELWIISCLFFARTRRKVSINVDSLEHNSNSLCKRIFCYFLCLFAKILLDFAWVDYWIWTISLDGRVIGGTIIIADWRFFFRHAFSSVARVLNSVLFWPNCLGCINREEQINAGGILEADRKFT